MCSLKCFWISLFLSFIAILIAGIVFWVYGEKLPLYFHSGVLTSIPVYSTTFDGYDTYGVVTPKKDVYVYPQKNLNTTNVSIEIPYSNFVYPDKPQTVYLLHNFWGYSINISIIGGDSRPFLNKIVEQNFFTDENTAFSRSYSQDEIKSDNFQPKRHHHHFWTSENVEILLDDLVPPHMLTVDKIIPSTMLVRNNVLVRCPMKTLFTSIEGAEPSCSQNYFGELIELQQPFQIIEIGDVVFHDIFPPIYVVFHNSQGFPMNFVDIPMLFFASWKKSNSKAFQITGIVATITSAFLIILFGFILFRASPEESEEET